ncbi:MULTISPECIES: hypothetical protein [unclassified Microbacterium]|uniref:hypothetical protein n=1 Tax=unclassified Microbacterium TaxID=2609290 RepID=UPI00301B1CA2
MADENGVYPDYVYTPQWREQRTRRLATVAPRDGGLSARDFWSMTLPALFGEVEIDLAQTGIIPDLDQALDTRPWHFIREAILRLPDLDRTWVQKAVTDELRRRRPDLQDQDRGLPDLRAADAGRRPDGAAGREVGG